MVLYPIQFSKPYTRLPIALQSNICLRNINVTIITFFTKDCGPRLIFYFLFIFIIIVEKFYWMNQKELQLKLKRYKKLLISTGKSSTQVFGSCTEDPNRARARATAVTFDFLELTETEKELLVYQVGQITSLLSGCQMQTNASSFFELFLDSNAST